MNRSPRTSLPTILYFAINVMKLVQSNILSLAFITNRVEGQWPTSWRIIAALLLRLTTAHADVSYLSVMEAVGCALSVMLCTTLNLRGLDIVAAFVG